MNEPYKRPNNSDLHFMVLGKTLSFLDYFEEMLPDIRMLFDSLEKNGKVEDIVCVFQTIQCMAFFNYHASNHAMSLNFGFYFAFEVPNFENPEIFLWKDTGKSLSEALIFPSTNPQYDDRLFIELQVQYMKIPDSKLKPGENMLCTEIVSEIQNNVCIQHALPMFCKKKSF